MKIGYHLKGFFPIWLCLLALCVATFFAWMGNWEVAKVIGGISLLAVVALLVIKPMNVVYGLMGTTGNIRHFFLNFILISAIFAGIYYWGFFKTAWISYDVNQPHIEFGVISGNKADSFCITTEKSLPIYSDNIKSPTSFLLETEELFYQRMTMWDVINNTIMTSLMQEPTELFAAASSYNISQDCSNRSESAQISSGIQLNSGNANKAQVFHIVLIFQILISWIFFGVFISLLYSKFRYES